MEDEKRCVDCDHFEEKHVYGKLRYFCRALAVYKKSLVDGQYKISKGQLYSCDVMREEVKGWFYYNPPRYCGKDGKMFFKNRGT